MKLLAPLALFLILICFSAMAESIENWGGSNSWIELHEPDDENRGARAAVTFQNEMVHGPDDNECFPLDLESEVGWIEVTICLKWNVNGGQNERMTVIPPDGYISQPPEVDVPEGQRRTIYIYGAVS